MNESCAAPSHEVSLSMWPHRAKQEALRAGEVGDKHAVPVNSYVNVHLQNVPSEKAQSIVERVTLANKVSRV